VIVIDRRQWLSIRSTGDRGDFDTEKVRELLDELRRRLIE